METISTEPVNAEKLGILFMATGPDKPLLVIFTF